MDDEDEHFPFFEPTVFDDKDEDLALSVLSQDDDFRSNGTAKLKKWYIDVAFAFAVHKEFKSHTGVTLSFGQGIICSLSMKQKANMRVRLKQNWLVLMTLYQRCCGRNYLF